MRKLLAGLIIAALPLVSIAGGNHHRQHNHRHGGHNHWVAPLIIGGVLGAAIASQHRPYVVPPVVQSYPLPPYGYAYAHVYDAYCACYRLVLVPAY